MATSLNNPAWVEWMTQLMGGVSRQRDSAAFPPNRFFCLLDELPMHLVPQHALRRFTARDNCEPLILNPDCVFCEAGELPAELQSRKDLVALFALQGAVAWVRSAASGNLLPFWLGPEFAAIARDLLAKRIAAESIPNHARDLLRAADILISQQNLRKRQRASEEGIQRASVSFRQKGYAPIGDLIHPFHVAALRRYYRYLIRSGAMPLGDRQSAKRYAAYNDPVARFFHRDIAATLSAVAGEPLKPSYVYVASYLSGAELKKHTDRKQCEFSVTFCLDFSPEPELGTPWPIRLETPSGTVTVYQALGDGLAYRGTRLPHYRDRLREGQTSTSIFFHYVSEDFTGSLD